MNDLLPTLLVALAGAALVSASSVGLSRQERKWVTASYLMHVAFACAQVPLVLSLYGGGDMFLYFRYGEILSQMMERDPARVIPEVTALLLHQSPRLPVMVIGAGTSTGTMSALAAWAFYLLGPSKYAASVTFASLSLFGKVGIYRVFRANVEPSDRWYAAIAALFIPSFVFWSSGLIKEAIVLAGFGWALYGVHLWLRERRPVIGLALMVAGGAPLILVKPYILFPLVLAGGSWYYWSHSLRHGRVRVRPIHLVAAALLGIGGIVVLGQSFPEYSVDSFATRAYDLQQLGQRGGSSFGLGGDAPTSTIGGFVYAPAALLAALFRPFIFEAHNVPSFVNALETALFTLLFARVLFTQSVGDLRKRVAANPFLVFCVVFVLAFGMAVGLASSNMGTLSRYRSPLMPFFALLLLILGKPFRVRASAHRVRGATDVVSGNRQVA